jgi:DNA (cytosine-5)-methyltransferase 1
MIVNKKKNKFTIVETFVGCGGAHLGFKQNGFKTLLANDIDKNMIDTLIINKSVDEEKIFLGSINDLTEDILKKKINDKVDVLFGGIVCKGFSLAGVRNPFDNRNYLYKEQLRIVKILKPKVSIIENVVGIKNMKLYKKCPETKIIFKKYTELSDHNKILNGQKSARRKEGKEFADITELIAKNNILMKDIISNIEKYKYKILDDIVDTYSKLGYNFYSKLLNTSDYGGYTNRKRFIMVAIRKDIKKEYKFPKKITSTKNTLLDALKKIDSKGINNPEIDLDNIPMNHKDKTIRRFKFIPEGKNIADIIDTLPDELKISKFFSRGNTKRLDRNKLVPTLVPGHSNFPIHPWEHRSITVREAATITGFPLDYKFIGSHSSRCMQVGNAVPIHLSDAIAKSIITQILQ